MERDGAITSRRKEDVEKHSYKERGRKRQMVTDRHTHRLAHTFIYNYIYIYIYIYKIKRER